MVEALSAKMGLFFPSMPFLIFSQLEGFEIMAIKNKPKLAVWKFSSCDGCQLSLLDCEDELLSVAESVQIAYFLEATRAEVKGPYDISLVEGSVSTPHDIERIQKVRRCSNALITIGSCATTGGIQALRNVSNVNVNDLINIVYAHPEYIDTLDTSTPIRDHVPVDFELSGCPINKFQLLEVLNAFLNGRKPNIPNHSQCVECKLNGTPCIMITQGVPCLGSVTQGGCGNLCPSSNRGCYGCFGPKETPNTSSLSGWMKSEWNLDKLQIKHLFRGFTANAEAFRKEGDAHE